MKILQMFKFDNLVKEKIKFLMVKINVLKKYVRFRGTRSQIDQAKRMLLETIDNIKVKKEPADVMLVKFIEKKETEILTWLKEKV